MKIKSRFTLFLLVAVGAIFNTLPCGAASYTWNGGSGDWSVAANWTPGSRPPGPSDTATVNGGTVTVSTDTTVNNFNLNGNLSGAATLTVTGLMNWTGGEFQGSGRTFIASGARLNLNGGSGLIDRVLENAGTVLWSNTVYLVGTGVMLTNRSGALFELRNNLNFNNGGGGTKFFDNAGTLRQAVGAGTTEINALVLRNYGTLEIQSGTLQCGDVFINTGTVTLSANTVFRPNGGGLSSGVFDAAAETLVEFRSFLLDPGAELNGVGLYRIGGGTVTFNTDVAVQNLELISALNGPGTLTVNGVMTSSGAMNGSGRTLIAPGGTLNLPDSGGGGISDRVLENAGTILWFNSSFYFAGSGVLLTNRAGGRIEFRHASNGSLNANGAPKFFDNAGTVVNTAGAGLTYFGEIRLRNHGTVEIQSGTLFLADTFTNRGMVTLSANTVFRPNGGGLSSGVFDAAAETALVEFRSFLLDPGAELNGVGLYRIGGGTVTFNTNVVVQNLDLISTLDGPGTLTVNGVMTSSGAMNGSGRTLIAPGATLNVPDSGGGGISDRVLENAGTILWFNSSFYFAGSGVLLTNRPTGRIELRNSANGSFNNGGGGTKFFDNAGTVLKTPGAGVIGINALVLRNDGRVEVQTGTLSLANTLTNQGTLAGAGTIAANVINNSVVSPGASPGLLTIAGNYTQTASGTLNIELGGTVAGTGYDRLAVSGTATLDGTLNVSLINGFNPAQGDAFQVLNSGTRSGAFGTVNGLGLGGNQRLFLAYSANDAMLTAATLDFTPVTLPNGVVGTLYGSGVQGFHAVNGIAPLNFSVVAGAMPPGLAVSQFTGAISGAPVQEGTYNFTVSLSDAVGGPVQREYSVVIGPAQPCVTIDGAWARWPGEAAALETINGFNGAAYTPGIVGQAFLFDGVDDYFQASVPYLANQQPGSGSDENTTLELWMRADAPAPVGGSWVAGWGTFNGDSWSEFGIIVDGNQRIGISLANAFRVTGPVAELGRWYHVAAVYENGYASLYVDGTLAASAAVVFAVNNGPVNIGRFPGPLSGVGCNRCPFAGAVDEPTIFTRALSAAEVQSIYNAGGSGKCRSLNNTVPNGTCEVIGSALISFHDVQIRGLAFDPWNQPVVAWQEGPGGSGGIGTSHSRWAFRTNGVWNTNNIIRQGEGTGGEPLGYSFALRSDGVPFFLYGVADIDLGNDNRAIGVYLVNGTNQPNGPGQLVYAYGSHGYFGGFSALGFNPGASSPDYVYIRNDADATSTAVYNGISQVISAPPAPGLDFSINTNGVHALFYKDGGGNVKMSRTPGEVVGPLVAATGSGRGGQFAGSVDGNDVFHVLMGGMNADADWSLGKLYYARSENGTNWTLTDLGPGVDFLHSLAVDLAIDPITGNPALAYFRAGRLWYAELICGHWAQTAVGAYSGYREQIQSAADTDIFRLAFDREGKPAIAVYDPGTTNLLLCRPAPLVQAPVVVCKNITVFLDATGQVTINGADVDGGSTADCGLVRSNVSPNSFTCANLGPNAVTLTIYDDCCQSASCQAIVTVRDIITPVIGAAGPDAIIECPAVPVFTPPTATDNCPNPQVVEVSDVTTPGACAGAYSRTKTWKAIDASGNESATVSQTITVRDTTSPLLSAAPVDTTVECHQVPAVPPITASDTCDANVAVIFSESRTEGTCANNYQLRRTWSATDACGNNATHTQTITIRDTMAPVQSATPANLTAECGQVPVAPTITASDTCDANVTVIFSESRVAGNCANNYQLRRTWSATDVCGNTASHTQTIIVQDTMPPAITAAGADMTMDCPTTPVFTPPTATDSCDPNPRIVETIDVTTPGACAGAYTRTKSWKAADVCGNESGTVSQTITVRDTTAPMITVPANATVACGGDTSPAATGAATANDNCSSATVTYNDIVNGTCPGTITRTWTATDACGNSVSQSQTITINASQTESCPIYAFAGFLPPIDGADATGGSYNDPVRAFKLGSTIPVKFRILCNSSPINDGVHTLQAIFYSAVTTSDVAIDATPTDAATTGNQFRLTGDGEWHFNLSTKAAGFKKGIWKLVATLADGTQHVVWIEIKK